MKTFCSYYNSGQCRSCDLIEIDYKDQIILKEKKLQRYSLLSSVQSEQRGFRNKAKFSVTGTIEKPIIGLLGEHDLDEGRELLSCPLHHPVVNEIVASLPEVITNARISPYNIQEKKGELKGIILFHSADTKETYLRFILRSKESIDRLKKYLPNHPSIKCISVNIQPIPHAILEGDEEIFLTETKSISHKISNITFTISPKAFIQTNSKIAEKLYETASDWIAERSPSKFLELFSGQGNFSFIASEHFKKGLGIEINTDAVEMANQMAKSLNLDKLQFISSNAQRILDDAIQFSPDLLLVNPPRRGLGSAIDLVKKIKAPTFIYSSCNATTLIEDINALEDIYEVVRGQVFDMFPQTSHFEVLFELRLKESIHNF